ncbi:MAG: acetylornithine deacetylase [Beijerinckiaceae bacterium]|nr:acetylornithine deacetylase [Beijerinckiaceae bacterium]
MTKNRADDFAAVLDLLERLVAFDTVSSKTNLPLIEFVESYLAGLEIESIRVPNAKGDKAALFLTIGPRIDGGVVLSGHTDVVPVEGQEWTGEPFLLRQQGGRIYGRGTCDMKGFDAICLAMLPLFQRTALKTPIHLLLSYDEEIGCLGSLDTIARFGRDLPRPAIAIVGEPTEMAVVDAHKSIATYKTIVHGKEAHSSKPHLGASAVEAACELVTELYRFAATLREMGDPSGLFDPPFSTIHVGKIEGGTARNIMAKRCAFDWEFRGLPNVDQGSARAHLDDYAARVVLPKLSRHAKDARIETHADHEVPGLAPEPGSPAETLVKSLTRSNATGTVSFATEAGQFQRAGISTIVCGPGSIDQAHQPDEYIEGREIEAGITFMHRLAAALS